MGFRLIGTAPVGRGFRLIGGGGGAVTYKTEYYAFRSSDPAFAAYPNDATQETKAFDGGSGSLYPQIGLDGFNCGLSATGTASNATQTNAGSDPLMAGHVLLNGAGQALRLDKAAGTYAFGVAIGPVGGGARSAAGVFAGSKTKMTADIGASSFSIWAPTTNFTNGTYIAVPDGGIWKVTGTGGSATGTVAPSGGNAGDVITDGDIKLTHQARSFLAVLDSGATSIPANQVLTQNNDIVLASAWRAASTKSIVLPDYGADTGLSIMRLNSVSLWLRCVSLLRTA